LTKHSWDVENIPCDSVTLSSVDFYRATQ